MLEDFCSCWMSTIVTNCWRWMTRLSNRGRTQQTAKCSVTCVHSWIIRFLNTIVHRLDRGILRSASILVLGRLNPRDRDTQDLSDTQKTLHRHSCSLNVWWTGCFFCSLRSELEWGYPLNLSISLSGGIETNWDFRTSGERNGKSSRGKYGVFLYTSMCLEVRPQT